MQFYDYSFYNFYNYDAKNVTYIFSLQEHNTNAAFENVVLNLLSFMLMPK